MYPRPQLIYKNVFFMVYKLFIGIFFTNLLFIKAMSISYALYAENLPEIKNKHKKDYFVYNKFRVIFLAKMSIVLYAQYGDTYVLT